MADLDRTQLIDLLGRLSDGDDAVALAAAREVSRKLTEAGLTWNELLQPDDATVPAAAAKAESSPREPVVQGGEARLIERLLARSDISETLRADLSDFKKQVADGKLHRDDAEYIRALAKRLGA